MVNIRAEFRNLWSGSPVLVVTALVMLGTFWGAVAGIFLDPRTVTGVPAWLKPAKFGISTAIYLMTIAWLYRYIRVWPRLLRAAAWTMSLVIYFEIAVIDIQAARGLISHFNHSNPVDSALFAAMGAAIGVLWLASVIVLAALFKQKFENRAWGWALRLGMLITVLGSASGGLMVAPTHDQLQALKAGEKVPAIGAHTVGAPDGGPGIPGAGWSTEHGDLRVPHFVGMHGIQMIPLFVWIFARRRTAAVWIAAASYVALFAILAWQALRGESIVAPAGLTMTVLAAWMAATGIAMAIALVSGKPAARVAAQGY